MSTTSSDAKLMDVCSEDSTAITHTGNAVKTSISAKIDFIDEGDYLLEVTVVITNSAIDGTIMGNYYHYSEFDIKVTSDPIPPSTSSPTSSPRSVTLSPISTPELSMRPSASPTSETIKHNQYIVLTVVSIAMPTIVAFFWF
mmetsp:Transcript_1600/g.2124  ORF Transcript_1600/g.2124 Transcript_1600/m.2124 type:complete len:142 (-) Transcript_1600:45-470(-)